jgi:hypothetical protein
MRRQSRGQQDESYPIRTKFPPSVIRHLRPRSRRRARRRVAKTSGSLAGALARCCGVSLILGALLISATALAGIHIPNLPPPTYLPSKQEALETCEAERPRCCCRYSCGVDGRVLGTHNLPPGVRVVEIIQDCPFSLAVIKDYFYPLIPCGPGQTFEPPGICVGGGPSGPGKDGGPGPTCGIGNPCNPATGKLYLNSHSGEPL